MKLTDSQYNLMIMNIIRKMVWLKNNRDKLTRIDCTETGKCYKLEIIIGDCNN